MQINISPDNTNKNIPSKDPAEYDGASGMVLGVEEKVNLSINSIYECENTEQLIKYYNASLGSHLKLTLVAAEKEGYLRSFPGLTAKRINRHIGVEFATEAGHMLKEGDRKRLLKWRRE